MSMPITRGLTVAVVMLAGAVLVGCGGAADEAQAGTGSEVTAAAPVGVSFAITNATAQRIREVALGGSVYRYSFNDIAPGATDTLRNREADAPRAIDLVWTDATGERHYARLDLASVAGRSTVRITIHPGGRATVR